MTNYPLMKKLIGNLLRNLNYKPEKKINARRAEGYPEYLKEATKLNIDVNDYLDNNLGWIKPGPVLEDVFFPVLKNIHHPKILELGPGTGRWTREILKKAKELNCCDFVLVDHSQWMIDFLNSYFQNEKIINTYKNNGISLPLKKDEFDIIFSQGVFIELKPSVIYLYSKEFFKVLKPGGFCVFDYFNCESENGWNFFINQSDLGNIHYTYYTDGFIEKVFESSGFNFEIRFTYGKSNFIVFKKTSD